MKNSQVSNNNKTFYAEFQRSLYKRGGGDLFLLLYYDSSAEVLKIFVLKTPSHGRRNYKKKNTVLL
jgi:hypothetical protein